MSNIEAIIVDGVRYNKVQAKTVFVCEECELISVCKNSDSLAAECKCITEHYQCWKRKE
jgi:hypothetical protein